MPTSLLGILGSLGVGSDPREGFSDDVDCSSDGEAVQLSVILGCVSALEAPVSVRLSPLVPRDRTTELGRLLRFALPSRPK